MKKCCSFIFVCFLLISYITNVFADEVNNDPAQQRVVQNIKSTLPLILNTHTTLVDVSIKNEMLDLIYEVINTPVEEYNDPLNKKLLHDLSVIMYCKNNPNDTELKASFPKGINYNYYIEGKLVLMMHVDKSNCKIIN